MSDIWPDLIDECPKVRPALPEPAPMPVGTLVVTIPGVARGKGRPRFGQGRTFTDSKTENAESWIKVCAVDQVGSPLMQGALALCMQIDVAVPVSWSRRKRADALSGALIPTCRPDLDNSCKLACDALNGIVWKDDAQIAELHVVRRYADAAQTVLRVRSLS